MKDIKRHDMKSICEFVRKNLDRDGKVDGYGTSIEIEEGVEIETELKARPHVFTCGTKGEVADELTIKVKFKENFNLQPHDSFEEELVCGFVDGTLYGEVYGSFDAQ